VPAGRESLSVGKRSNASFSVPRLKNQGNSKKIMMSRKFLPTADCPRSAKSAIVSGIFVC
jgi:hypothetical protein